jgi:hypothetical protein
MQLWKFTEFVYPVNENVYYTIGLRNTTDTDYCLAFYDNIVQLKECSQTDTYRFWWIKGDLAGLPADHYVLALAGGNGNNYLYRGATDTGLLETRSASASALQTDKGYWFEMWAPPGRKLSQFHYLSLPLLVFVTPTI